MDFSFAIYPKGMGARRLFNNEELGDNTTLSLIVIYARDPNVCVFSCFKKCLVKM